MNNSGTNTILLLFILAIVIFGVFWFFKSDVKEDPAGLNIDLNIPAQEESN